MSYVCAYSSVQLDKRRVEKEFTTIHNPIQPDFPTNVPFLPPKMRPCQLGVTAYGLLVPCGRLAENW